MNVDRISIRLKWALVTLALVSQSEAQMCFSGTNSNRDVLHCQNCTNLKAENWTNLEIREKNLNGLNIEHGHLNQIQMFDSRVEQSNWKQSHVRNSSLVRLKASKADTTGMMVYNSRIDQSTFEKSQMAGTHFHNSVLSQVSFANANMRDFVFDSTSCESCDFRGADMRGSVFFISTFENSKFNSSTQLPVSDQTARKMGMIKVDSPDDEK